MKARIPATALIVQAGAVLAREPSCPAGEMCEFSNDKPPLQSPVPDMPGRTVTIFGEGQEEPRLRLSEDGTFNYLITIPDPEAPRGKDQTLYRSKYMEG